MGIRFIFSEPVCCFTFVEIKLTWSWVEGTVKVAILPCIPPPPMQNLCEYINRELNLAHINYYTLERNLSTAQGRRQDQL